MGGLRPLIFIYFQIKRKGGFYFMPIIVSILLLVIGMVLLIKGADFFVEGASNIAKALHIPTLVIGLTLTLIHILGIPFTGTSVNPARSFGPALLSGGVALNQVWLFILAPLVGSAIAAFAWKFMHSESK